VQPDRELTCDYPPCDRALAAARLAVRDRPPRFVGLCALHVAAFDTGQQSATFADFWNWLGSLGG